MTALATELGLLSFFLTFLAAVLAPLATFGDHARAGGVGALLKGFCHGHLLCRACYDGAAADWQR